MSLENPSQNLTEYVPPAVLHVPPMVVLEKKSFLLKLYELGVIDSGGRLIGNHSKGERSNGRDRFVQTCNELGGKKLVGRARLNILRLVTPLMTDPNVEFAKGQRERLETNDERVTLPKGLMLEDGNRLSLEMVLKALSIQTRAAACKVFQLEVPQSLLAAMDLLKRFGLSEIAWQYPSEVGRNDDSFIADVTPKSAYLHGAYEVGTGKKVKMADIIDRGRGLSRHRLGRAKRRLAEEGFVDKKGIITNEGIPVAASNRIFAAQYVGAQPSSEDLALIANG